MTSPVRAELALDQLEITWGERRAEPLPHHQTPHDDADERG